jgi:predicted DNA-binding transcriptional regulator AlpA
MSNEIPETVTLKIISQRLVPVTPRTLERWQSCGRFPKPDIAIGQRVRLWRSATVLGWIAAQQAATGGNHD